MPTHHFFFFFIPSFVKISLAWSPRDTWLTGCGGSGEPGIGGGGGTLSEVGEDEAGAGIELDGGGGDVGGGGGRE